MYQNIELLREALMNSCRSACFGEEFRRVYYDSFEIENASTEELIQIARRMGVSPSGVQGEVRE